MTRARPNIHERLAGALARRAGLGIFRFFTRTLDPGAPAAERGGLELRVLREPDVLPLCGDANLDLHAEKVSAAYGRGDLCAGAFESGRLAELDARMRSIRKH